MAPAAARRRNSAHRSRRSSGSSPTVGLDPLLRRDLWELFRGLAAAGTTVLVSSHVMDEAVRCDRLLLLREGRLVADDSPSGLLRTTGSDDVEHAFLSIAEAAA